MVFASYLLCLGLSRSLATDIMMVRFSHTEHVKWYEAAKRATGAALALGVVLGIFVVLMGVFVAGGPLRPSLIMLGPVLPGLLLQDAWRFVFFSEGLPQQAALNDALWAVLLLVAVGWLAAAGIADAPLYVLAWGGSSSVAAVIGVAQSGLLPDARRWSRWIRVHLDLGLSFLGDFTLAAGLGQVVLFLVASISGLPEAGALRAGFVLLGPLNVLFMGTVSAMTAEGSRLRRQRHGQLLPLMARVSYICAAAAMVWGVAAAGLMPPELGRALLGQTWSRAEPVIAPLVGVMAGIGAILGPLTGLRILEEARRTFRIRAIVAPIALAAAAGGAMIGGAPGAAAAWAGVYLLSVPVWWVSFKNAILRDPIFQ